MSTLVSFATCRRCQVKIEIPPLPVIIGEEPQQKAARLGALEMATICTHLVKEHPEARDHMTAWGTLFSEFYWLAQFDLTRCKILLDQYDAQRLQLLSTCQRDINEHLDGDAGTTPREVFEFFTEHDRAAELEKAGYRISKGFLQVASGENLIKTGG
jgi:hypothetical protein